MQPAGAAAIEADERRWDRRRRKPRQSRRSEARGANRRLRWFAALGLAGLLGVALLGPAVPQLVGTVILRAGWTNVGTAGGGSSATDRLIASSEAAARWTNSPGPWQTIAWIQEARARAEGLSPEDRQTAREEAEAALRRALALSPASAGTWLELARLYLDRGDRAGASRAVELSFATGWAEGGILLQRSRFTLENWNLLEPSTRQQLAQDFADAVVRVPDAFARIAVQTGREEVIRKALRGVPSLQRQFDQLARRFEPYRAVLGH